MRKVTLIACLLCLAAGSLIAIHVMPDVETVPIDRVVKNLERMISEDPTNIEVRVNLARLHSIAYASKVAEVRTFRKSFGTSPQWAAGQPYFGFDQAHLQPEVKAAADGTIEAKAREHL